MTLEGRLDGVSPPLTASHALDLADVARILGAVTDRTITRVVVDDDEWTASAVARGMPASAAEFTLGMFRAARRGEFAVTDPTLQNLLGREPVSAQAAIETIVAPRR